MKQLLKIVGDRPNDVDLGSSNSMYYYKMLEDVTLIKHNHVTEKVLIRFTFNGRRVRKWVALKAIKQQNGVLFGRRKTLNAIINR